ncbi:chromatin remodeling 1 [Striga asiatica]|uniref:Chromatin remodeling 1 n=1 Tax=Striga asiatica TaxID=4170 RepID=A0A5A7RIN2_STRAF|nr:chromatin remodeling 1 [Striga asiatica]
MHPDEPEGMDEPDESGGRAEVDPSREQLTCCKTHCTVEEEEDCWERVVVVVECKVVYCCYGEEEDRLGFVGRGDLGKNGNAGHAQRDDEVACDVADGDWTVSC